MLARQANADIRVLVVTGKIYLGMANKRKGPRLSWKVEKRLEKYVLMPASRPF